MFENSTHNLEAAKALKHHEKRDSGFWCYDAKLYNQPMKASGLTFKILFHLVVVSSQTKRR